MSKKKVSGNTMTLKNFHGGSIPSDLPLPSAPGVIVRPSDRPGYERPAAWGNQMGRVDHRSRPHTSPASRHLDDKAPFLTHAAHIGRNFDEDERKPLNGVVAPTRPEPRQESASGGGLWGRQGAAPMSQVNSHSGRVVEASLDTNNGQGVGGAYPNVWAVRKEAAGITERLQSPWSAPMAVSKLAHASALEKVSSGRWQSKHSMHQSDAELVRASETESGSQSKDYGNNAYNKIDAVGVVESYDATLARHGKRVLNVDDYVHGARKEFPDYERTRAPANSEVKEKNPTNYRDSGEPDRANEKFGGTEVQTSTYVQPSERSKLKLHSRTKPLESVQHTVADHIQGHQKVTESVHSRAPANSEVKEKNPTNYRDSGEPDRANEKFGGTEVQTSTYVQPSERSKLKLHSRTKPLESVQHTVADHIQGHQKVTESVHTESFNEAHGNLNPPKFGIAHTESEKPAVERPKLKLKPRSQPAEQSEGNVERGRNLLFGGARPRELVLKERGFDDVALNHDLVQHPERVEHHVPRTERISARPNASRYSERTENRTLDQRFGKKSERRDHEMRIENPALDQRSGKKIETKNHRVDDERIDTQRRNWHSENWKNTRDTEKQQQLERAPSPETWRKPVEQPKPTYGKAASAIELAQAFSRSSVSEPSNRLSGQRSLPSHAQSQIPFSRLMGGPTPRPQINGY